MAYIKTGSATLDLLFDAILMTNHITRNPMSPGYQYGVE